MQPPTSHLLNRFNKAIDCKPTGRKCNAADQLPARHFNRYNQHEMPATIVPAHKPRWYWVPVRVLLITFLLTLLTFAVCLFLGIIFLVIYSLVRGMHPNMALAYRHFAFPAAILVASILLVIATIMEIRGYRQAKTLAGIARASS
jgi:hypothetical protein